MRPQESLDLYNSLNTLWSGPSLVELTSSCGHTSSLYTGRNTLLKYVKYVKRRQNPLCFPIVQFYAYLFQIRT